MDANGARILSERIRLGVRIGDTIELVAGATDEGLESGDRGIVSAFGAGGVVVEFERGVTAELDPSVTPFRRVAA